ncbi:unnamed protein product, partial [Ectocarpus fasciculatus]
ATSPPKRRSTRRSRRSSRPCATPSSRRWPARPAACQAVCPAACPEACRTWAAPASPGLEERQPPTLRRTPAPRSRRSTKRKILEDETESVDYLLCFNLYVWCLGALYGSDGSPEIFAAVLVSCVMVRACAGSFLLGRAAPVYIRRRCTNYVMFLVLSLSGRRGDSAISHRVIGVFCRVGG